MHAKGFLHFTLPLFFGSEYRDNDEISIPKTVLPRLPEGYKETLLGDRRGAIRQFRHPSGLHVREYSDRFVIHRDSFDPRSHPVRHLIHDSPETILALGACLYGAGKAANRISKKREQEHESSDHGAGREFIGPFGSLGSFILAFLSLNSVFRFIKRLIFS